MLKLIYILSLFLICNSEKVYVKERSILEVEYYNKFNFPISIKLNNYKYRESSILPKSNGIFSIMLNPGYYTLDNNISFDYKLIKGEKLGLSKYHLKDKLIKKNIWNDLEEINYFKHKTHLLNIRFLINVVQRNNEKINYDLLLMVNDKEFYFNKITKKSFIIKKDNIKLEKGNYRIRILAKSNIDYLCSCPSINDGFYNGRSLFIWSENKEDEKNMTIKLSNNTIENYVISLVLDNEISNTEFLTLSEIRSKIIY